MIESKGHKSVKLLDYLSVFINCKFKSYNKDNANYSPNQFQTTITASISHKTIFVVLASYINVCYYVGLIPFKVACHKSTGIWISKISFCQKLNHKLITEHKTIHSVIQYVLDFILDFLLHVCVDSNLLLRANQHTDKLISQLS